MKHILKNYSGSYFPSFFNIHIETTDDPNEYLRIEKFSTIIHEYIHFLQDISTIYGLSNFSKTCMEIAYFYHLSKGKTIAIPVNIFTNENDSISLNNSLFSLYFSRD